jgi:hypothetical protein
VTIAINTSQMNICEMLTADDVKGTILEKPEYFKAYSEMVVDSKPSFFIEHLERLSRAGIQPHFMLGHVAQLETVERLIRKGLYRGPLILNYAIGGGAAGLHPADMIEFARRTPDGAVLTIERHARGAADERHGDRAGAACARGHRGQPVGPQRRTHDLGAANRADRASGARVGPRGSQR